MPSISGCTVVRNAVRLKYPLEASILSYLPICGEIVLAYDPQSDDGTEAFVKELAKKHSAIRLLPSVWNPGNHAQGTEIALQSNFAIESCVGDWVLYVQADEAIHEEDSADILTAIQAPGIEGCLFDRSSFLFSLDREIPSHRVRGLLRLFRNGSGFAVGDGMTCRLLAGSGEVLKTAFRMFNYSRIGSPDDVAKRCGNLRKFYQTSALEIAADTTRDLSIASAPFDQTLHPRAMRSYFEPSEAASAIFRDTAASPDQRGACPVTLIFLLGPNERKNLVSFLRQFRQWPGDIVVVDDNTTDGGAGVLGAIHRYWLSHAPLTILRRPLNKDFGAARNAAHEAARGNWVFHSAPDEALDPDFLSGIPALIEQLERDGKAVCAIPRANFLDGTLVNDIPDRDWTEERLKELETAQVWPPGNMDMQYRLMRKSERWIGRIHEVPASVADDPSSVVALSSYWILHNKTLANQRRQDILYRTIGQTSGLPHPISK